MGWTDLKKPHLRDGEWPSGSKASTAKGVAVERMWFRSHIAASTCARRCVENLRIRYLISHSAARACVRQWPVLCGNKGEAAMVGKRGVVTPTELDPRRSRHDPQALAGGISRRGAPFHQTDGSALGVESHSQRQAGTMAYYADSVPRRAAKLTGVALNRHGRGSSEEKRKSG